MGVAPNFFLKMQVKVFSIPIVGGEKLNEDMNVFLRSKKILQIESQIINQVSGCFWTFCIRYIDDVTISDANKVKVDYKEVLDDNSFKVFSRLREIRKKISTDEGLPAYAIFTDEELSNIAKLEEITIPNIKKIKGIGEKKVEKFAAIFLDNLHNKSYMSAKLP